MSQALILLSGGLDSLTCLAVAQSHGHTAMTLTFDYGQRGAAFEVAAARHISQAMNCPHLVYPLDSTPFAATSLVDRDQTIESFDSSNSSAKTADIPSTYVPARNIVFLTLAAALAETRGIDAIYIGASSIDYSGYPDCRPECFEHFQRLLEVGTKAGVQGKALKIETPLLHLSKADTICLGEKLGVDYSLSTSCYQVDTEGRACGRCESCGLRAQGFQQAGVADPTHYVVPPTL